MPGHRALECRTLLVHRVDRFSHSLRDLTTLLDDLDDAGVVFRSATEPFDTADLVGRMLVQMLGAFAEFEQGTIIDRVIAGMERKAAKGLWTSGVRPPGYLIDRTTADIVPVPAERPTIETIFNLYTIDRLGTQSIATLLNERGMRTRLGRPWSQHTVDRSAVRNADAATSARPPTADTGGTGTTPAGAASGTAPKPTWPRS